LSDRDVNVIRTERERRGAMTEKDGFSVVAATRMT